MRTVSLILLAGGLVSAVAFRARTPVEQPKAQQPVQVVTAADMAALIAKQPKDSNTFTPFIQAAPFVVNMEHRVKSHPASVHERNAELFVVLEGSGTLVTGGALVGEKRTNEANLSGTAIQGGASRTVRKGDWVLVPEGVPHQFPTVAGLHLMSVHLPRVPAK
jgi:mannose-6-phosphate isomerase-like protein (cupin superfamily)